MYGWPGVSIKFQGPRLWPLLGATFPCCRGDVALCGEPDDSLEKRKRKREREKMKINNIQICDKESETGVVSRRFDEF